MTIQLSSNSKASRSPNSFVQMPPMTSSSSPTPTPAAAVPTLQPLFDSALQAVVQQQQQQQQQPSRKYLDFS
jgi:hypothetical protein